MKTGDKVTIEATVIDIVHMEADINNVLVSNGEHEMWVRSDFISVPEPASGPEPAEEPKKSPAKKMVAKK